MTWHTDLRALFDRLPSVSSALDLRQARAFARPYERFAAGPPMGELLGAFGAGLVVGAAVALFLAPRSGPELRSALRELAPRPRGPEPSHDAEPDPFDLPEDESEDPVGRPIGSPAGVF